MKVADLRKDFSPGARERKRQAMLDAAVKLAEVHGYQWLTKPLIAEATGRSGTQVNLCFGTLIELKREVLREAVRTGNKAIVAQGLADRHEIALAAPEELKREAAASLSR